MIAEITGELKVTMVYTNQYDDWIVMKYGVYLAGWPLHQSFTNPSGITSLGNLNILDAALKDDSCRWERLKEDKFAEWKERLQEEVTAGTRKALKWVGSSIGKAVLVGGERKRSQTNEGVQESV